MKIKLNLLGDRALIDQLAGFRKDVRDRILKPVVKQVGEMVAAAAKSDSPNETGLLRKSIGVSAVKVYKGTGTNASVNLTGRLGTFAPADVIYAAVGPRRGFGNMVAPKNGTLKVVNPNAKIGPKWGRHFQRVGIGTYRDPVKYGHLVEDGHAIVRGTRETGRVLPKPFMAPAASAVAPAARALAASVLSAAIQQQTLKLKG